MSEYWKKTKRVGKVQELNVYIMAFEAAMKIFHISKTFPIEEKFGLTDQMRRSSRSVCSTRSSMDNNDFITRPRE